MTQKALNDLEEQRKKTNRVSQRNHRHKKKTHQSEMRSQCEEKEKQLANIDNSTKLLRSEKGNLDRRRQNLCWRLHLILERINCDDLSSALDIARGRSGTTLALDYTSQQ